MLTEGSQKMHRAKYTNNMPRPSCWYKEQLLETLMPDKPKPTVCLSVLRKVTGLYKCTNCEIEQPSATSRDDIELYAKIGRR